MTRDYISGHSMMTRDRVADGLPGWVPASRTRTFNAGMALLTSAAIAAAALCYQANHYPVATPIESFSDMSLARQVRAGTGTGQEALASNTIPFSAQATVEDFAAPNSLALSTTREGFSRVPDGEVYKIVALLRPLLPE